MKCIVCGGCDWNIAVSHYEKAVVWVLRCVGCGHDKIAGALKGVKRTRPRLGLKMLVWLTNTNGGFGLSTHKARMSHQLGPS